MTQILTAASETVVIQMKNFRVRILQKNSYNGIILSPAGYVESLNEVPGRPDRPGTILTLVKTNPSKNVLGEFMPYPNGLVYSDYHMLKQDIRPPFRANIWGTFTDIGDMDLTSKDSSVRSFCFVDLQGNGLQGRALEQHAESSFLEHGQSVILYMVYGKASIGSTGACIMLQRDSFIWPRGVNSDVQTRNFIPLESDVV